MNNKVNYSGVLPNPKENKVWLSFKGVLSAYNTKKNKFVGLGSVTQPNKPIIPGGDTGNYEQSTIYYFDTTSTKISIPEGVVKMDIFLVGGGGGGGAWPTWNYTAGTPGLGGECFCKRNIPVNAGSTITIKCGAGGKCATDKSEFIRSAQNGGDTTLTVGNETYTAIGGIGGYNGYSNSKIGTKQDMPDGTQSWYPLFYSMCTEQAGHDTRVQTENGIEGTYMMGLKMIGGKCWITVNDVYIDEASTELANTIANTAYPNIVDYYEFGVPAFFEEGQDTFGALGTLNERIRNATTIGPVGSTLTNSEDKLIMCNTCGYGGGGFGGRHRDGAITMGGNGTSGAVVIRWYIQK